MDWNKAKNIILVLLVALNIFLVFMLVPNLTGRVVASENIDNTITILAARKITLECDIPRYNQDQPRLIYGSEEFGGEALAMFVMGTANVSANATSVEAANGVVFSEGSRTLTISDEGLASYSDSEPSMSKNPFGRPEKLDADSAESFVRKAFKNSGVLEQSYIRERVEILEGGGVKLVFTESYNGLLIFDNCIKVTVTVKGITGFESSHREVEGVSAEKLNDLVPAYQILLKLAGSGEEQVITGIDMGYKDAGSILPDTLERSEQPPVWRITIKGANDPLYYDASTGAKINF